MRRVPLPNGAARVETYDLLGRLHAVEEPDPGRWLALHWGPGAAGPIVRDPDGFAVAYEGDRARTARTETVLDVGRDGLPRALVERVDGREWRVEFDGESILYPQAAEWLRALRDGPTLQIRCGPREHLVSRASFVRFSTGAETVEEIAREGVRRFLRVAHRGRDGVPAVDLSYECDGQGRITRAGDDSYAYDAEGRLARSRSRSYRYDRLGRLAHLEYDGDSPMVARSGAIRYAYDASGRRVRKEAPDGATAYEFDALGLLSAVVLPTGEAIRYVHDGFGRLVAREDEGGITYYVSDLRGRRLAEADGSGRIVRSYLWIGRLCVASTDGPIDGPLVRTFHRVHAGRLAAIGDAEGRLRPIEGLDPYGADAPIERGVPGYAGLFGDPDTGLLLAGSRWLDPAIGQFLTPDSWFGRDPALFLPPAIRRVARALPGGPDRPLSPSAACNWCEFEPINRTDPDGHNWFLTLLAAFSATFWELQLTSLSLQLEAYNIALEPFALLSVLTPCVDFDDYKRVSIFNGNLPMASNRLNVPLAIPLNGTLRGNDRGWTLGNIIWVRGSKWRSVEASSKRDLLVCTNASDYVASTAEVATDVFRARSPFATATATAAVSQLTGVALTAPSTGATLGDVFDANDWLSIRKPGASTEEIRPIAAISGTTFTLGSPPLPPALLAAPAAVDVTRLDPAVVKISKGDDLIARTVTFIRGTAVHYGRQIPEGFPVDGLDAAEFMPAGKPNTRQATANTEFYVVRLKDAAGLSAYAANDFVRVRNGSTYFARTLTRKRGTRDLILSDPLPAPAPHVSYARVEVVKLDGKGSVTGRNASGVRVNAGTLVDLRKFDGLTVENTGGTPVTVERRIVLSLRLDCTVAPLPSTLRSAPIVLELMNLDTSAQANGTNTAAAVITTTAGQAGRFSQGRWVRVRKDPANEAFVRLSAVDGKANTLTLADPLDATAFPVGTAVSVTLLADGRALEAEDVAAPGDHVVVVADDPTLALAQDDLFRVSLKSNSATAAVRVITAPPEVIAVVNDPLPASHASGLTVRRFAPVDATLHADASTPKVQLRFTLASAPVPFAAGDAIHLRGFDEEAWATVAAVTAPQDILLTDPIEHLLSTAAGSVRVRSLAATGKTTSGAHLDESHVLIPSDPDADPITHREAFEQHEMRHVAQGALWGPFLLSLPIPWLIRLGASASDSASDASSGLRHVSTGFADTVFALAALGVSKAIGQEPSEGDLKGSLGADLKTITFASDAPAGTVAAFTEGSPVQVSKGDTSVYNEIAALDAGARSITLRFALDGGAFAANDQVVAHVSPFEKIRKAVKKVTTLGLVDFWSGRLPDSWQRGFERFMDRDSWFPLGIYPLSLLVAGFDEDRLPTEQDAAYHSGDLYTSIAISRPSEVFVGQFSAVFGFLNSRSGDEALTLSRFGVLQFLSVELPAGGTADDVAGSVPRGTGSVTFRENWYIPMSDKVDNVVGAFFAASKPGEYLLHVPGELPPGKDIVFTRALFDVGFLKTKKVKVKPLTITPAADAANPLFETEDVTFRIAGDRTATYRIQYDGPPPTPAATISGLRFTIPPLPADAVHNLTISATYAATHPIFKGPGQLPARLTADQLTNFCQKFPVQIKTITLPSAGPVKAGKKATIVTPIAPSAVRVTSPLPAGAAVNARVVPGTGRPATSTFFAPNAVTAASNVTIEWTFGTSPHTKVLSMTINVTP